MKVEPKFYRLRVDAGHSGAGLICVTYNLDTAKPFVGVEYYELVSSFEDEALSIPAARQATFKEELRVLHQAASTYKGPRKDEQLHIEHHIKLAYGSNVTVSFEEIQPKN